MRLDGFGLLVDDMAKMIRFYRDVLGFEIKEEENTSNVYLVKDGTLFLLYGRNDFEKMTSRRYEYIKGLNGHFEIALYVDTFEEVDEAYKKALENGAESVLAPELEPWGQRTCYIADPEGNLIEIGSWNKPYEKLTNIFNEEDIAICGIVEAELLHGARSEKELYDITEAISCFERLYVGENWNHLGRILYRLRKAGVTLPFTDAVIAQIAINNDISILTNDHHFKLIQSIIPELKLYEI